MTQEQVEGQLSASQLSAMFDGELPAAECELLSRRLDRDEKLRARWSRYALIGAAMRSEPVATARSGFASRVGAALDAELGIASSPVTRTSRAVRTRAVAGRSGWNTALAASMVAAVAGVSIALLRYSSPAGTIATVARADKESTMVASPSAAATPAGSAMVVGLRTTVARANGEPSSYVTPVNQANNQPASGIGLQTELADYMFAHSEYSTSLMRRSLLSALVSNEDTADMPVGKTDAMPAASAAAH